MVVVFCDSCWCCCCSKLQLLAQMLLRFLLCHSKTMIVIIASGEKCHKVDLFVKNAKNDCDVNVLELIIG